jgi:hypothetical protein
MHEMRVRRCLLRRTGHREKGRGWRNPESLAAEDDSTPWTYDMSQHTVAFDAPTRNMVAGSNCAIGSWGNYLGRKPDKMKRSPLIAIEGQSLREGEKKTG